MNQEKEQKSETEGIVIIYDEGQERLSANEIWKESIVEVTNLKMVGLAGQGDAQVKKALTEKYDKLVFITADKEEEKPQPDYSPNEKWGVIRFRNNRITTKQKLELLYKLRSTTGFKNAQSIIGRDVKITSESVEWTHYKNTTFIHKKKIKKRTSGIEKNNN